MDAVRATPLRGLACLAAALLLSCGGSSHDRAGRADTAFRITPATATLTVGQSLQFKAEGPAGSEASWAVRPEAGGTVTASGLFTASGSPGQYTLVAMARKDVRYTATAQITILPAPPPVASTPGLVQASGAPQASPDGRLRTAGVVGETVPQARSEGAGGAVQVRHGFAPPIPVHGK